MALSFPVRLFNPKAAKRLAVLSVQPSSKHQGQLLLQLARGAARESLLDVELLGPFTPEAVEAAAEQVIATLIAQGYSLSTSFSAVAELGSGNPRKRALAALTLGWRGDQTAAPKLIELVARGKQDVSSAVTALGLLEAARGVDAVRAEAERKLLSRRRAGAEALRASADTEALASVRARALERLEPSLAKALATQDEALASPAGLEALCTAFDALPTGQRGLALDTLYELGTPLAVATTLTLLGRHEKSKAALLTFGAPQMWRYVKSIWKRSMARFDFDTFATVTLLTERLGRVHAGERATLKSGLDGEAREVTVFSKGTARHVRGRAWRFIKRVALFRTDRFLAAAIAVLAAYRPEDDALPRGRVGATGGLYLLHRLLLGRSTRFELAWRTLTHRFRNAKATVTPTTREEAYPELWDAEPTAWVRLLGRARRLDVAQFALTALEGRAAEALRQAPHADVVQLLDSPFAAAHGLALEELVRRFDPERPDWDLLARLSEHPTERARALGTQWLERTLPAWSRDDGLVLRFVTTLHPAVGLELARRVGASLGALSPEARARLTAALMAFLRVKEPTEGAHLGASELLCGALLDDAVGHTDLSVALSLLLSPSLGASSVGSAVIARLPNVLETLGWNRIAAMARDERVVMRAAAMAIVRAQGHALASSPAVLFEMVESDWDDVRSAALEVLASFSLEVLTFDGLVALLDSPRVDVQTVALQKLERCFEQLDPQLLLSRLAQHPHRNMRGHVLALVEQHLKPSFVQLAKVEPLLRTVLFDAERPSRDLKRRTIAFLERRGQLDALQAELAQRVLADAVRTETRADRERLLKALALIRLAFPEVSVPHAPTVTLSGAAP